MWVGLCSLQRLRGGSFLASPGPLVASGAPGFWLHLSSPCLHLHVALLQCLKSLSFSYKNPSHWRPTLKQPNWLSQERICLQGRRHAGSIPGSRRSPGGGNGDPLQYSCRDNPTDRGAWQATVHRVKKTQSLVISSRTKI